MSIELSKRYEEFEKNIKLIYDNIPLKDYYIHFDLLYSESINFDFDQMKIIERNFDRCSFEISCFENEYEQFKKLIDDSFTPEQIKYFSIKMNKVEVLDFNLPEEESNCNSCQKLIDKNNNILYYCIHCKIFFCDDCVKARRGKKGYEALVHKEHYLLAFKNPNPDNFKRIEKYKLGKNLFGSFEESKLIKKVSFRCSSYCVDYDYSERYICLTCKPGAIHYSGFVDFFYNCFRDLMEYEKFVCEKVPEHKKDHVYLQMIYPGNNYYDF